VKPEDRITTYLFTNKSKLQFSTIDLVVKDIKLFLFYGMSPISDERIREVVVQWASIHAIGLLIGPPSAGQPGSPAPGSPPKNSDSEFIDAVKKAISVVTDGVTIGKKGANVNIGVTGLTANLKKAGNSAALSLGWTGTLKLDAKSGPMHFSGKLAKDKWEITLSFPQDTYIPDMSTLGKVFTEGEKALGKMAEATRSFDNITDVNKISALIKPNAAALQDAVDAASGIANASPKGGSSFGFRLSSPEPGPGEQGIPQGVQGSVVFTYVF
jgi:hypothetical protein